MPKRNGFYRMLHKHAGCAQGAAWARSCKLTAVAVCSGRNAYQYDCLSSLVATPGYSRPVVGACVSEPLSSVECSPEASVCCVYTSLILLYISILWITNLVHSWCSTGMTLGMPVSSLLRYDTKVNCQPCQNRPVLWAKHQHIFGVVQRAAVWDGYKVNLL